MAASDTSSEPPAKRQKVVTAKPRTLLKDLPADQFIKYAALWNTPPVIIVIHGTEIPVPKGLLCYNSSYFNSALRVPLKEGTEQKEDVQKEEGADQKVDFRDCSAESFQLAVSWMYFSQLNLHIGHQTSTEAATESSKNISKNTSQNSNQAACTAAQSNVTTPAQSRQSSVVSNDFDTNLAAWATDENIDIKFYPDFVSNGKAQILSRYLAFLRLADRIELLGPFDSVYTSIKQVISSSGRKALLGGHIRFAAELSPTHGVRKLFADACYREFVQDLIPHNLPSKPFRFDQELNELDSFSSDLLRSYRESEKKKGTNKKGGQEFIFTDPFTEMKFNLVV